MFLQFLHRFSSNRPCSTYLKVSTWFTCFPSLNFLLRLKALSDCLVCGGLWRKSRLPKQYSRETSVTIIHRTLTPRPQQLTATLLNLSLVLTLKAVLFTISPKPILNRTRLSQRHSPKQRQVRQNNNFGEWKCNLSVVNQRKFVNQGLLSKETFLKVYYVQSIYFGFSLLLYLGFQLQT